MTTASPVVAGLEQFEIVFGANQPEYNPLPALVGRAPEVRVISRWVPTPEERQLIAEGADIYTSQMTFNDRFQPLNVQVGGVNQDAQAFMEAFNIGDVLPEDNLKKVLDGLLE